jgi:hypothetical protein
MNFTLKNVATSLDYEHWKQESDRLIREAKPDAPPADPFFANLISSSVDPVTVDLIGQYLFNILRDDTQPIDTRKHAGYYMAQVHEFRGEWTEMAAMLDFCGIAPGQDDDVYDFLQHSGWAHVFRQAQDVAIARGIPPIHVNSLWHSGSSFLAAFVTTALQIDRCRTSKGPSPFTRLVPGWLSAFLRGGATTHEHFSAAPENIAALEAAGASLVTVHVRHPVATIISMYHLFKSGFAEYVSNADRPLRRSTMAAYAEVNLDHIVHFMETWRSYALRPDRKVQVAFTRYEDMIADPAAFGRALLARHLGHAHAVDAAAIMHKMNEQARREKIYNFKETQSNRLLNELDGATQEVVNRLGTPALLEFFDYKI